MGMKLRYLTCDEIIAINRESLKALKVKKADSFKVLSHAKISKVVEQVQQAAGDVYDKAAILLKGLAQEHPFASGNRRTAMLAAIRFLRMNGCEPNVKEDAEILQGIRENYYSDGEIKSWLKGGELREFRR